jgi:hypothetical protein
MVAAMAVSMTPGAMALARICFAGGFAAEHAHHGLHAGFGGGVVGLAEEALDGGDAAKADDGTVVAHDFERVFAAVKDAGEVHVDDGIPFIEPILAMVRSLMMAALLMRKSRPPWRA